MSLFKHKRVKGWWPFNVKNEGEEMELTVSVGISCHLFLFKCFMAEYLFDKCVYICVSN